MIPRVIELEIGELILEGLPAHAAAIAADALVRELTRLFTERGLPPGLSAPGEWGSIDAPELNAAATRTPEALGVRAAQAIYEGMVR